MGVVYSTRELFGSEDKDYRQIPATATLSSLNDTSPASSVPQSAGWANFKASRPEEFPFQQPQSRQRLQSCDTDMRPTPGRSPSNELPPLRRPPLLPTPPLKPCSSQNQTFMTEERNIIFHQANEQLSSGQMTQESYDEVLHQLQEMDRLQVMKTELCEKREKLQADFKFHGSNVEHTCLPAAAELRNPYSHGSGDIRERFSGSVFKEERGLLGDKPASMDTEECKHTKALLPTPPDPFVPISHSDFVIPKKESLLDNHAVNPDVRDCEETDMELWEPSLKPWYNTEQFYVAEHDVRWLLRSQMQHNKADTYSIVIDGRLYDMMLNSLRRINFNNNFIEVRLDSERRELLIDQKSVYRLGEVAKNVFWHGREHLVFAHGPQKKLWIDGQQFEININAPPEKINIGGKEHDIRIDGFKNLIIVDGYDICPFDTEEPQSVTLAFVLHTIEFKPPPKQILIDNKLCSLNFGAKYPFIMINYVPHGIRFDGQPKVIYIDDRPWMVPTDKARKFRLDGPKPRLLAFGGPGHEVIIDDQWYEVKFNGLEKFIKFGRRMHKVQLKGTPPEVKILGRLTTSDQIMRISSFPGPSAYPRPSLHDREVRGDVCDSQPSHVDQIPSLQGFGKFNHICEIFV